MGPLERVMVAEVAAVVGHGLAVGEDFAQLRPVLTNLVAATRPITLSSAGLLALVQSIDERVRAHIDPLFAGELVLWWETWMVGNRFG